MSVMLDLYESCKDSDKNTIHSFLEFYNELFESKKDKIKNILEIGIWSGGSIKLWEQFFQNANVWGCDITDSRIIHQYSDRVKILIKDAYKELEEFKDVKFDIVIDDGPHSLASQILCIDIYYPKLTGDGILIIEDVQNDSCATQLMEHCKSKGINSYIKDLRGVKGRYDDLLIVVEK